MKPYVAPKTTTPQELYDAVVAHLRKQGCQSKEPSTGPAPLGKSPFGRYRQPKGRRTLMCAAGALISDEHYRPEFEGYSVHAAQVRHALLASGQESLDGNSTDRLLRALQHVHDVNTPDLWESAFRVIAQSYDLIYRSPK